MSIGLQIPDAAVRYILFQRTAYLQLPNTLFFRGLNRVLPFSIYNRVVDWEAERHRLRVKRRYRQDMFNEYMSIKPYLPDACAAVLDVGCGVAGIDVLIGNHFTGRQPHFYLLDKSQVERAVYYRFRRNAAFYNSLDVARSLLTRNGISAEKVHLIEATEDYAIAIDRKVELVLSLISWGYHYPVDTYLDCMMTVLSDSGSLIMDIRKGTPGLDLLRERFISVELILDEDRYDRVVARHMRRT